MNLSLHVIVAVGVTCMIPAFESRASSAQPLASNVRQVLPFDYMTHRLLGVGVVEVCRLLLP
jgi:hypothetical protein